MKLAIRLLCLALSFSASALARPDGRQVVSTFTEQASADLKRTTLTVQEGASSFNRFEVVRLQRASSATCAKAPRGKPGPQNPPSVILLAPFGFPAAFWEQSDDGSYDDAFAPRVALAGYDVWLMDSRLAPALPGQCESGAVDCSPMQGWGMETSVQDAMFVERLARHANPKVKPVIGGMSGGSSTALAAVNAWPNRFRGVFLWEGTLLTDDPQIRARNAAFCQDDRNAFDQGVYFDGSVQVFQLLFGLAEALPDDATPIPVFPPGTTNLQALLFALTVPDPTNPLNFTEGFIRFVGDPMAGTLVHGDLSRVLGLGGLVGNYAPVAFIRDSHCAMAGLDTTFTSRLDKFRGSALVFAEGFGFNQMMLDTAGRFTRANVTVDYQPTFGESDRFFHVDWRAHALEPFLQWLAGT